MRFCAREEFGVFRTRDYIAFQTTSFQKDYPIPLMFPKTDIQLQAKSVGDASISGSFDFILVNGK